MAFFTISVIDAFKISSNNAFRELACKYYEENPREFTDKLYEYKLTEAFDFDISGMARPEIVEPGQDSWSGTTLPSIAIGYTNTVTPLHTATFYNAVANRGVMVKPYLVEAFEKDGKAVKKFGTEILNGSICKSKTADTLVTALRAVVLEGTGKGLKDAKCQARPAQPGFLSMTMAKAFTSTRTKTASIRQLLLDSSRPTIRNTRSFS